MDTGIRKSKEIYINLENHREYLQISHMFVLLEYNSVTWSPQLEHDTERIEKYIGVSQRDCVDLLI